MSEAGESPPGDEAPAPGPAPPLERLDREIYAVEAGLVTGALLVMAMTYFLQIVHREMIAGINAFDRLLLRWAGHETVEAAPDELKASISGVWTPTVLGILIFIGAVLAMRTRDWVGVDREAGEAPEVNWGKRLGWSVVVTGVFFGVLKLVAAVPAQYVCIIGLVGMAGPAIYLTAREKLWGGLTGAAIGGGFIAWFFLSNVEGDYIWSMELSSVLLMYVGFFGASMATRDKKHIQIDFIRKKVPPKHLGLYNALSGLLTLLFCVFLMVLAVAYLAENFKHEGTMAASKLPHFIVSLPIPIALALMIVRFGADVFVNLKAWKKGEVLVVEENLH